MYGKGILNDIQDFGHWMELKASVIANDLNQNTIQIELSSDDIVENQNSDGGKYGTGKFEEFLKAQRKGSVKCLVRHIRR